jgi:hypothetical protein
MLLSPTEVFIEVHSHKNHGDFGEIGENDPKRTKKPSFRKAISLYQEVVGGEA